MKNICLYDLGVKSASNVVYVKDSFALNLSQEKFSLDRLTIQKRRLEALCIHEEIEAFSS